MARDLLKEAILEARQVRRVSFENAKDALVETVGQNLKSIIDDKLNIMAEEGGADEMRKGGGTIDYESTEGDETDLASGDCAGEENGASGDPLMRKEEEELDEGPMDFWDDEDDEEDEFGADAEIGLDEPEGGDALGLGLGGDEFEEPYDDEMDDEFEGLDTGIPYGGDDEIELELDDSLNNVLGLNKENTQEYYDDKMEVDEETDTDVRQEGARLRQRRAYKKIVNEYKKIRKANLVLVKELRQSNLFNAKLAYTFRIIHANRGLTPLEQKKIIETIDKAKTIREAKLIHKTIRESLRIVEKTPRKKNIHESASRSTRGKAADLLQESCDGSDRMMRLAGITEAY